eukprot:9570810-Alexandrium_andersonii.AAC.1
MLIGRAQSFCPCRGPRSLGPSAHLPTHGRPTRSASWLAPLGCAPRTGAATVAELTELLGYRARLWEWFQPLATRPIR